MSEAFIGEIRLFAGTFAPRSWALCDGQLLAISQNDALFSLLGTTYGGDGRTTFGLPDLRGRVPIHQGNGPGLPPYNLGAKAGAEHVTLTPSTVAAHSHAFNAAGTPAGDTSPVGNVPAQASAGIYKQDAPASSHEAMAASAILDSGGGQAHNNLMPFLCINFIICLFGVYPSRS